MPALTTPHMAAYLIAADSPNAFLDNTPTAKLAHQVLGAIAEFDRAMTVAKLRGARERKRKANGKCEGRKAFAEMKSHQHVVLGQAPGACQPEDWRAALADKTAAELVKMGETLVATAAPGAREAAQAYFARDGQP
jgi:hypothetical protein